MPPATASSAETRSLTERYAMSRTERLLLYLYGTPNIVGSLLGIVGLLLFFAGVIQDFWFVIIPGLYLIGVLLTPKQTQYDLQLQNQFSADAVRNELNELVNKISKRTPPEILAKVESIKESVFSILPILTTTGGGDRNLYTVRQMVFDYLPAALQNYLNLPPAFANLHPIRNGKTARQLLSEQLDLMDHEMKEIVVSVSENDTQKLLVHGRFLEAKFNQADFLGSFAPSKPAPLAAELPPLSPPGADAPG